MIKAYLTWVNTLHEGEDIEIRYSIFENDVLIKKESFFEDYTKPALSGLLASERLLEDLEEYSDEVILVVIHDGALFELLSGSSGTHNREVQAYGREVRKKLEDFKSIQFEDITGDHLEIEKWSDILKP